jgi:hypothetical protein
MIRRSSFSILAVHALLFATACSGNIPPEDTGSSGGTAGSVATGGSTASGGSVASGGAMASGGSVASGGSAGSVTGGSDSGGTAGSSAGTGGSGGTYVITAPMPQSQGASWVFVDGYQLFVGKRINGTLESPTPYEIKGIGWSPTGVGQSNDSGYSGYYNQYRGQDAPLMEELNANTVKTYDVFTRNADGNTLLNDLYARGIMVIMSVLLTPGDQNELVENINYFKDHPAILMWVVGNEFNYNDLYGAGSHGEAVNIINAAVDTIHNVDPDHPVAVSHGEVPTLAQYNEIPNVDLWSINIYPGLTFASRFNNWINLSDKPMFVGEYGSDAWNSNSNTEDQAAQSVAIASLAGEIHEWVSSKNADLPVLGGTPYSLTDEWWKSGNPDGHDNGGFENAIHPDNFANEEWWGLCTIQRGKRTAFNTLAGIYAQ